VLAASLSLSLSLSCSRCDICLRCVSPSSSLYSEIVPWKSILQWSRFCGELGRHLRNYRDTSFFDLEEFLRTHVQTTSLRALNFNDELLLALTKRGANGSLNQIVWRFKRSLESAYKSARSFDQPELSLNVIFSVNFPFEKLVPSSTMGLPLHIFARLQRHAATSYASGA